LISILPTSVIAKIAINQFNTHLKGSGQCE
jgi:hypothetical protein